MKLWVRHDAATHKRTERERDEEREKGRERERELNHIYFYAILWRAFNVLENKPTVMFTSVYYCISQRRIFLMDIYEPAIL